MCLAPTAQGAPLSHRCYDQLSQTCNRTHIHSSCSINHTGRACISGHFMSTALFSTLPSVVERSFNTVLLLRSPVSPAHEPLRSSMNSREAYQ